MHPLDLTLKDTDKIINFLTNGKIGVMPTDTIYGLVGLALNPQTVEAIYLLRKRDPLKPLIILISSLDDLKKFNINLSLEQKKFLKKFWPNPVSVILPCLDEKFSYLHRGKSSLSFRMPKSSILLQILKKTGPLVAPSANFEGTKPSENIAEAKKYFGDKIAFYVTGGKLESKPSTIIQLYEDGTVMVLREGAFKLT